MLGVSRGSRAKSGKDKNDGRETVPDSEERSDEKAELRRNPQGRVFAITPWRLVEYWKMTSRFDSAEYEIR